MKKIRVLLFVLAMCFGVIFSVKTVQAAGLGHVPNVGDCVYEDQQYITNNQYDKLSYINDTNEQGVSPQRLILVVFKNDSDLNKLKENVEGNNFYKNTSLHNSIVQNTKIALYTQEGYYADDAPDPADTDDSNNYLIYDIKNGRVFFDPSDQGSSYITDLMFIRMYLGLSHQLKHGSDDEKMTALFQLVDKLDPKIHDVSQTKEILKSTDSSIFGKIETYLLIIAVILIFLMFMWRMLTDQDNGPGSGSSDYDAGFDEGAYYGSQQGNNYDNDGR